MSGFAWMSALALAFILSGQIALFVLAVVWWLNGAGAALLVIAGIGLLVQAALTPRTIALIWSIRNDR